MLCSASNAASFMVLVRPIAAAGGAVDTGRCGARRLRRVAAVRSAWLLASSYAACTRATACSGVWRHAPFLQQSLDEAPNSIRLVGVIRIPRTDAEASH